MEEGPRTITIERRWAIGSVVATFVLVVAMAIAIIVVAGSSDDERGIPEGSPAVGFQSGGMPPGAPGADGFPVAPGTESAPTP